MRINDVMGQLVSAYTEWNHVLANPRFVRRGRAITWRDYSSAKLVIPIAHSEVVQLYEAGQYSFQTTDGSLLQLSYSYARSRDELVEARLAFYKVDEQSWEVEEPIRAEGDGESLGSTGSPNYDEAVIYRPISISWLRIDYSPKSACGVLHNSCHLHLSAFPAARVAVAGVPTPRQFVEFVVALCYPDIYRNHRLDNGGNYREPVRLETVNSDCVAFREDLVYRQITHFRVPGVLPPLIARRSGRR